jgi:hypothetical protein
MILEVAMLDEAKLQQFIQKMLGDLGVLPVSPLSVSVTASAYTRPWKVLGR